MKTMQLNWKRSLATFALLAAFNGPDAAVAMAQSDKPVAASAAASEVAPAQPTNAAADSAPSAVQPPAAVSTPAAAADVFRRRYGLVLRSPVQVAASVPATSSGQAEREQRGVKLEAKLKQIVFDEVTFNCLPLPEVLRFLSDEAPKRDPEKVGVNFLINPNPPPGAMTRAVDPATGLPLAAPLPEATDLSAVVIKFILPLRHVTLENVLDAIVKVASRPIEYSLEDYAVVFSAAPVTVPEQITPRATEPRPMAPEQPNALHDPSARQSGLRLHAPRIMGPTGVLKPQTFNVDFGPAKAARSGQTGPAAAGRAGDFWNTAAAALDSGYSESNLKFASGEPGPITLDMINLGGSWGSERRMGVSSAMLNTYNYPAGNQGGDSAVILHRVPAGKYHVYIYGHGVDDLYYGDYTLTVGDRCYGRKATTHKHDAVANTKWVEGSQYVKFSNVKVAANDNVEILIHPGGTVTEGGGRTFSDAMICGLQLIPAN